MLEDSETTYTKVQKNVLRKLTGIFDHLKDVFSRSYIDTVKKIINN